MLNWIAKNRAKKELLEFYRMVRKKRLDILYSDDDKRYKKYYDEVDSIEKALAYILYTKFDCDVDRDVAWDYRYVNDEKMQEYIDNLLESDKRTCYYVVDSIDEAIEALSDTIHKCDDRAMVIEAMSDSIYKWDGYRFVKYY